MTFLLASSPTIEVLSRFGHRHQRLEAHNPFQPSARTMGFLQRPEMPCRMWSHARNCLDLLQIVVNGGSELLRLLQIKLDLNVLPFVQNCETICESSASRANSQPSVESWTRTDTSAAESACRNYSILRSILRSMQHLLKFPCCHQELCCHPSASWGPIFSG